MYFGQREIRELLRSLYRDLYRYPLVEKVRETRGGAFDVDLITHGFQEELRATRFLGVGNPSESGTHLLYYFRQENELSKDYFINTHEIFTRAASDGTRVLRHEGIRHYVFIDDVCGSGTQAKQYSEDIVVEMKSKDKDVQVYYYALFGLEKGLSDVRSSTLFDKVDAVFVLNDSFKCFSEDSRYFLPEEQAERLAACKAMGDHGERLCPGAGLGYKDGQLLLGFFHNIPDNTLPIIWCDNEGWIPVFRRYAKIY
jgi:hypothetical protein